MAFSLWSCAFSHMRLDPWWRCQHRIRRCSFALLAPHSFTPPGLTRLRRICTSSSALSSTGPRREEGRSLLDEYKVLCCAGQLREDESQEAAMHRLQELRDCIRLHWSRMRRYSTDLGAWRAAVEADREREREEARREQERLAAAPFWERCWAWLNLSTQCSSSPRPLGVGADVSMQLPDLASTPGACGGCGAQEHVCKGGRDVVGERGPDELSAEERRHPFWTSGLGAAALRREAAGMPDANDTAAHAAAHRPVKRRAPLPPAPSPPPPPKGLFVHGEVGVGKTLLLDLFAQAMQADAVLDHRHLGHESSLPPPLVRRVHFNAFIIECHHRLHTHSQAVNAAADVADGGSDGRGGWNVMVELVRQLVRERTATESSASLETALDAISHSIMSSGGDSGAKGGTSGSGGTRGRSGGGPSEGMGGDGSVARPAPPADAASGSAMSGAPALADAPSAALAGLEDAHGLPVSLGVLCFDEVQMMDIADATIVNGVLQRLTHAGWLIVATCNRSPTELDSSALHRNHSQARFASHLLSRCETFDMNQLVERPVDYRQQLTRSQQRVFFPSGTPAGQAAAGVSAFEERFVQLTGGCAEPRRARLPFGRSLSVLASAGGVARLSFGALCDAPLGAADYISLAQAYHT